MESYETEWLAGEPVLLAIMHLIGLFDRPASSGCLKALRAKPAIEGLTDQIVKLQDGEWQRAVARLREGRLLAPSDAAAPEALDGHQLVREWFGERLLQTNEVAWKAAHRRLYEHLRDTTSEGREPTLEDLAPLYQAIAHGCRAGRHQDALYRIYVDRICRRDPRTRQIEYYASKRLGAIGINLAVISWFFDKPYETPAATLDADDRSWLIAEAAVGLVELGRLVEALPALREALLMAEDARNWSHAAARAHNLSGSELLAGQIVVSIAMADKCLAYADHAGLLSGAKDFTGAYEIAFRAAYAKALHAAGRRVEAERRFGDVERRQRELDRRLPLLHGITGYFYCDLLLDKGHWEGAHDRATNSTKIGRKVGWVLEVGLDALTLARIQLGKAIKGIEAQGRSSTEVSRFGLSNWFHWKAHSAGPKWTHVRDGVQTTRALLNESVDRLRTSGRDDYIPCVLLARAALHRSIGDWAGTARDLDEVEEIAEPGQMRLFLCDMALERVRLFFARSEAFAPLNGLIDEGPPKPERPSAVEHNCLRDEAAHQIAIAVDYIETCGYHRRDEELAELQAVLRGERSFASLPPRV
jgi:hypothetical protein